MDSALTGKTAKAMVQGGGLESVLEISALSRPLDLGTLYNARTDQIIPGIGLWNSEDIKVKTLVSPQPQTRFQVSVSELLSEKTSLLDVGVSVKASFLCGLVEIGGSAHYLNAKTSSARQCSTSLHYHVTTVHKELMMNELKVQNPEVFDMMEATHVVVAVKYGADAIMDFQEKASDSSKKQEIQANLSVMIKKIPLIDISAEGSLKMNDEDKEKVKNFSCKFYGDFNLSEIPTTFEEAVKVYRKLPTLLGENGEQSVPVKVWLYPLSRLSRTECKLKNMIPETLVSQLMKVMDDFQQAKMRTNDLIEKSNDIKTEDVVHKLEQFQRSLDDFTNEFQRKMATLIPAIREGSMKDTALKDLLKAQDASGFNAKEMDKWLDGKETELKIVRSHIEKMKDCEIKPPGPELDSFLMNTGVNHTFVFSFTSLADEEPYLKKISQAAENFMNGGTSSTDTSEEVPWYLRSDVWETLNSSVTRFTEGPPLQNKIISFISDLEHPGASIRWYLHRALKDPHVTAPLLKKYACELTLDPNTANTHLILSEGDRKVTWVRQQQPYPDLPERFNWRHQVLCREALPDHCYLECEWSGREIVVGVAFERMNRKRDGLDTWFGGNGLSWCLLYDGHHYSVWHENWKTDIRAPPTVSRRIGVYLNRQEFTVSFYSVSSDTLTLLHTFKYFNIDGHINLTEAYKLSEPLYVGFEVGEGVTVSLC